VIQALFFVNISNLLLGAFQKFCLIQEFFFIADAMKGKWALKPFLLGCPSIGF
jgi:hypothetical protein